MDYVLHTAWLMWLIIGGVCLIGEIITVGFILMMPGVSGLVTALLAALGLSWPLQIAAFSILTVLLLIFIKPILCRFVSVDKKGDDDFTIVGKTGFVTEDIDVTKNTGLIKIGGDVWSAVCDYGVIESGTPVKVVSIIGVKAKVEKINTEG